MSGLATPSTLIVLALSGTVAYFDIRYRRIPNWLIVSALLLCVALFAYVSILGGSVSGIQVNWLSALTGFVVGLAFFFPLWRLGIMGGGDVKLISVLGFAFGLHGLWQVVLLGSVLAGLHAGFLLLIQGWSAWRGQWQGKEKGKRGVPFGAHLALATLVWKFWLNGSLFGL